LIINVVHGNPLHGNPNDLTDFFYFRFYLGRGFLTRNIEKEERKLLI